MKIALVYDRVNKIGGAERILTTLFKIFPKACLYTAVYNKKTASWADNYNIIPSFLQYFPFAKTNHEMYPFATPFAFESFTFDDFDIVISITSQDAKAIITKPDTLHICYCLTPTRYLWSHKDVYFKNPVFKFVSSPFVSILRKWDYAISKRPDIYFAISHEVKRRIKKFYKRDATVIYPPVDTSYFTLSKSKKSRKDFFLIVSRLVSYKCIDLAIKAFNKLQYPLVIVGKGLEEKKLKRLAKSNISFVGNLTGDQLRSYYQSCRALIFPQEEDFGLSAVEAQACGASVIAYGKGGAREIIIEGETGEFFDTQDVDAVVDVINLFLRKKHSDKKCRDNALRFSKILFKKHFVKNIDQAYKVFTRKGKIFL